ncbi:winged helix-turn-helix transcriptional regulator [Streptomyces mobaraensis]|uniref:Helix-turn-helix transcriptional regulator n=1 Tax=Streptomyces mobaraensis TaxID=35621 RepID=A0A5N5W0H4_STRMB|nr:helix-turn-helix domain-containing protein [Streptomyces mobaraensis]KAB7834117.1 helix-turn-helix transcriptional regulator [Streptomyces mobaraensis]
MTKLMPYHCPIDAAMHVIEGKWKVLILWELREERRRFGALRRSLPGVSEKVLTQQLRELEADGIVRRRVHDAVPPKVDYSLTEDGHELYAALAPLGAWAVRRMLPPDASADSAA